MNHVEVAAVAAQPKLLILRMLFVGHLFLIDFDNDEGCILSPLHRCCCCSCSAVVVHLVVDVGFVVVLFELDDKR